MAEGSSGGGGISGSDEGFVSFAFAVTSVALLVLYIPWMLGAARRTYLYYQAPRKLRSGMDNPVDGVVASLLFVPRIVATVAREPRLVVAGARVCARERVFFVRCVLPKFVMFMVRPRILVLWLWVVLFSSAMYASLTFDPYAVLELPRTASTSEVKKAYRALSKRYHPDQNHTAEARDVYVQVRRAYKALVDRDAFEEEMRVTSDFAVGVALPRFLTSREHDGLVLFGLLATLIALPVAVWYRFMREQTMTHLLWQIRFDKERVERFMRHFGIPDDPRFIERRDSRQATRQTLVQLGILPRDARDDAVAHFPPFVDFLQRCVEADKNASYLRGLGLSPAHVQVLHQYMSEHGVELLDAYEAAHADAKPSVEAPATPATHNADDAAVDADGGSASNNNSNNNGGATMPGLRLCDAASYRATRYLFQQHTAQVDKALTTLLRTVNGNLPSARKLLNLHEEMYDLLALLYKQADKPNKQLVQKLMAMPQRTVDLVDAIQPELQVLYKRAYKNYMQQAKGETTATATATAAATRRGARTRK